MSHSPREAKRLKTSSSVETSYPSVPSFPPLDNLFQMESLIDSAVSRKRIEIEQRMQNPDKIRVNCMFNLQILTGRKDSEFSTLQLSGWILDKLESPIYISELLKNVHLEVLSKKDDVIDGPISFDAKSQTWSLTFPTGSQIKARATIYPNYKPPRYVLGPELAELVGNSESTIPDIVNALWIYIRTKNLQDPEDHTVIHCNEVLGKALQCGECDVSLATLSDRVEAHVKPLNPIVIECIESVNVVLEGFGPQYEADIAFFNAADAADAEAAPFDVEIKQQLKRLHEHQLKEQFMSEFARDPIEFVHKLIESQTRDLKIIKEGRNRVEESRSSFYKQSWVAEAAEQYIKWNQK